MSELRALRRTRRGSSNRSIQGRLSIDFGEDGAGADPRKVSSDVGRSGFRSPFKSFVGSAGGSQAGRTSPPAFHPLAYRSVVADWPVEWREQWGRRANTLEEKGLAWRDAEAKAFVEIWNELRREQPS